MHKNRLIKFLIGLITLNFLYHNKSLSPFLILLVWLVSVKGGRTLRNMEWITTQSKNCLFGISFRGEETREEFLGFFFLFAPLINYQLL